MVARRSVDSGDDISTTKAFFRAAWTDRGRGTAAVVGVVGTGITARQGPAGGGATRWRMARSCAAGANNRVYVPNSNDRTVTVIQE